MNFRQTISAFFLLLSGSVYGQAVVEVPEINIVNRLEYNQNFSAGNYSGLLNLLPTISVRSTNSSFLNQVGGTNNIPVNLAYVSLVSIGNISLIGTSTEVNLSTSYGVLGLSLANLLSGPVTANLRLPIAGHTWRAGEYQTTLEFLAPGLLGIGNRISPAAHDITIHVPGHLQVQNNLPVVQLTVDNFNQFRTGIDVAQSNAINLSSTVPYIPSIRAESPNYNFNSSSSYNQLPIVPVSSVQVRLIEPVSSGAVSLSTNDQQLTGPTGIPVPVDNSAALNYSFGISKNSMQQHFLQAGTYSTTLTYGWDKTTAAYPTSPINTQRSGELEIVVNDLSEIIANHQTVNLVFSFASNFQNGVYVDLPGHLKLSKTSPYNVYVRAVSNEFSSSTDNIPLSVLQIGPAPGETGMQTVTLSNSNQLLVEGMNPVIDRLLNVRYSIPASQTEQLVNKPSDIYSTDIIFSLVAP